MKLLTVPVDFAYQRRARESVDQPVQSRPSATPNIVQETVARCAGRLFFDAQAQRLGWRSPRTVPS